MRLTGVLLLLVTTACVPGILTRRPPQPGPGDGGRELPAGVARSRAEWGTKKVTGKEDPNVLIAADQARCVVSAEKYREVSPGESVFCAWAK